MARTGAPVIITAMRDATIETPDRETDDTDGQRRFDVHDWLETYLAQMRDEEVVEELVGVPLS